MTSPLSHKTGTTVRIIGIYASCGVQVQKIGGQKRVPITGLNDWDFNPYVKFETMFSERLYNLLPVLRPHVALSVARADAPIPAVAVARLLGDDRQAGQSAFDYLVRTEADGTVLVQVRYRGIEGSGGLRNQLQIFLNWDFAWTDNQGKEDRMQNVLEAYDYLRGNLFAMPVAGKQLVEGVDFVALEELNEPENKEAAGS